MYLKPLIFNSSAKSNRIIFLTVRKYLFKMEHWVKCLQTDWKSALSWKRSLTVKIKTNSNSESIFRCILCSLLMHLKKRPFILIALLFFINQLRFPRKNPRLFKQMKYSAKTSNTNSNLGDKTCVLYDYFQVEHVLLFWTLSTKDRILRKKKPEQLNSSNFGAENALGK